jgi:hypothetical protein
MAGTMCGLAALRLEYSYVQRAEWLRPWRGSSDLPIHLAVRVVVVPTGFGVLLSVVHR